MEAERRQFPETEERVFVPAYMKEILAEFTGLARRHPEVNQRSGVSVRVSIANYETLVANALRRAIRLGEKRAAPRVSDLPAMAASTVGKVELESVEEGREAKLLEEMMKRAVLNVFDRHFTNREFDALVLKFDEGLAIETGPQIPSKEYAKHLKQLNGLTEALRRLQVTEEDAAIASGVEFVMEGLHLNRRLNKDRMEGGYRYRR